MSRAVAVLLILSLGAALALAVPGRPPIAGLIALALGILAIGVAAGLIGRALGRGPRRLFIPRRPVIVVDGSNVMHWQGNAPTLGALELVLADLVARGFVPHVFFDANVGYKLMGRPVDRGDLARRLALESSQLFVAPSRTPADPLIIAHAIKSRARVVSNDRFMDWRDAFPTLGDKGFLVRGRLEGGRVELRLD